VSLNKVMIIGNLGRDPEMRYTPSGQAVTQFTVAVNRNYKDSQGEWQEETEWFRIVAWAQLAERTAENLRKGRKVYVEGRLQTRQWEDQSGQKRYTTEVIAQTVTALDRRPQDDGAEPVREPVAAGARAGGEGQRASGSGEGREPSETYADDLDDLPF
jgi:single-strand DNA-binding protein